MFTDTTDDWSDLIEDDASMDVADSSSMDRIETVFLNATTADISGSA